MISGCFFLCLAFMFSLQIGANWHICVNKGLINFTYFIYVFMGPFSLLPRLKTIFGNKGYTQEAIYVSSSLNVRIFLLVINTTTKTPGNMLSRFRLGTESKGQVS